MPGLDDALHLPLYGALAIAFIVAAFVIVAATRGRLGYRAKGAAPTASDEAQPRVR